MHCHWCVSPDIALILVVSLHFLSVGSNIWHQSPVLQQWRRHLQFLVHPSVLFFFQNVVSICDRNGNILDCVESCRTPTWVSTPFKEWISLGCNELYMKVKHRVAWNRLCNGRRSPEKWRTRHFPGNNKVWAHVTEI